MQAQDSIFSDNPLIAFEKGMARFLVENRCPTLGNLLTAERSVFYIQILYRMKLFRQEHELEPLYEDLFEAVSEAQTIIAGEPYSNDQFRSDLSQLSDWTCVHSRIEKQRIQGYRDNRKKKFRYRLSDECLAFLSWLEERLLDDLEGHSSDARNQLEDVNGALKELFRLLRQLKLKTVGEDEARRILHQLFKLEQMTTSINTNLSELNARLLSFVTRIYSLEEVKQILNELESYVARFLRQVYGLRKSIDDQLEQLPSFIKHLNIAHQVMEQERKKTPHLMRRNSLQPEKVIARFIRFYQEQGFLDQTCRRIDHSSLEALRKMYAHLREMERKNHRMEDLKARIDELASLPENKVPSKFFRELVSSAHGYFDQHHWDGNEKAEPPKPKKSQEKTKTAPKVYLQETGKSDKPLVTMEEARLDRLKEWLEMKVLAEQAPPAQLSLGKFTEFEDFSKCIELASTGFLNKGQKLKKIGYRIIETKEQVETQIETQSLSYKDLEIEQQ